MRRRPAVEVHGIDRARAVGDRGLGRGRGSMRRGVGVDVDEHGRGPRRAHRGGGGHRGERGHDHLVAGADAQRGERQAERVGARRHAHRVAPAGERGELGLERVELGTEQVRARPHDARRPPPRARARATVRGGRDRRSGTRRVPGDPSSVTGTRVAVRGRTRPCASMPSANDVRGSQPSIRFAFDESPKYDPMSMASRSGGQGTCSTRPVPAAATTAAGDRAQRQSLVVADVEDLARRRRGRPR